MYDMGSDDKIQLTREGLESLKAELSELRDVKRPAVVERLSNARSQGDLTENSDYHNAKEELEFLDGRISQLEEVLQKAVVVERGNNSEVSLGAKVTLLVGGKNVVYEVVGEWEADPVKKKISHSSPLGKSLIGKKVGDKVEVEAPAGKVVYEILSVE
jgi:transcription elongation factor GreA